MNIIKVDLGQNSYNIIAGVGNIKDVGNKIKNTPALKGFNSVFVVTSPKIGNLYEKTLLVSLKKAKFSDIKVVHLPDGEKYKNTLWWEKIIKALAKFDNGENKKVFVVNLGGGVVGDLGGFVAATYHRRTPYVQIPTTLLACVDCGVGGKVGVNLGKFKNSIGAFHQPKLVFADLKLLETLSTRQLKSGIAEVIKYGVALDGELLNYFNTHYKDIANKNMACLLAISKRCYEIKADIVRRDELDNKDVRITLNYGHTIGHAVEIASRYVFLHGEAVAIGILCANDISVKMGILNIQTANEIENIIKIVGLPTKIKNCKIDDIMDSMTHDKKFVNGKNRFVLLKDVGNTIVKDDIDKALIKNVIKNRFKQ